MFVFMIFLTVSTRVAGHGDEDGCGHTHNLVSGEQRTVIHGDVQGANGLTAENREYKIYLPSEYDWNHQHALGIWLHGWGSYEWDTNHTSEFMNISDDTDDLIVVWPKGMDDYGSEDGWDSWNFGCAGDDCATTCEVDGTWDTTYEDCCYCYDSCVSIGQCGDCNWATCHDDKSFLLELLDSLRETYCIDWDRIYIAGESNGGMAMQYLLADPDFTSIFKSAVGLISSPPLGFHEMPQDSEVLPAFFQFFGLYDTSIPWEDGIGDGFYGVQNYFYTPVMNVSNAWAEAHECTIAPVEEFTMDGVSWDAEYNVSCYRYADCNTLVGYCSYAIGHDYIPNTPYGVYWVWTYGSSSSNADDTNVVLMILMGLLGGMCFLCLACVCLWRYRIKQATKL